MLCSQSLCAMTFLEEIMSHLASGCKQLGCLSASINKNLGTLWSVFEQAFCAWVFAKDCCTVMACGSDPCAQSSGIVVRRWTPASVDGAAVGLGGSPHGASIWGALVLLIYPVCILTVIMGSVLIQVPEHSVFLGLLIEFSTLKEWQLDGFLVSKWFIHPKHLPELSTYRHLSVVMLQPGRLQWHAPV